MHPAFNVWTRKLKQAFYTDLIIGRELLLLFLSPLFQIYCTTNHNNTILELNSKDLIICSLHNIKQVIHAQHKICIILCYLALNLITWLHFIYLLLMLKICTLQNAINYLSFSFMWITVIFILQDPLAFSQQIEHQVFWSIGAAKRDDVNSFQTIGGDRMVGPLGLVVSPFQPTSRIEGRGPFHHVEAARHLILDCPASEPLLRAIFGTTSSILTSGPDLGAWPECWVSVEFLHVPIPRKGSGSTTTTM